MTDDSETLPWTGRIILRSWLTKQDKNNYANSIKMQSDNLDT
jgi:hypothetical protein